MCTFSRLPELRESHPCERQKRRDVRWTRPESNLKFRGEQPWSWETGRPSRCPSHARSAARVRRPGWQTGCSRSRSPERWTSGPVFLLSNLNGNIGGETKNPDSRSMQPGTRNASTTNIVLFTSGIAPFVQGLSRQGGRLSPSSLGHSPGTATISRSSLRFLHGHKFPTIKGAGWCSLFVKCGH
jgi:hypothetical protein